MRKEQNTESSSWQTRCGKKKMLLSAVGACLSVTLLSSSALAEGCISSPSCTAMGYTESSCSDGGVKCPFGNYWFCATKCEDKDPCQSCYVGWILNSDMTCSYEKVSGKTPIGVVANRTITSVGAAVKCVGMAVALSNIGSMDWRRANSQCNSYSASGVTGWHLPTKEELLTIHGNICSVQGGLTKAGGTQFQDNYYWSSAYYETNNRTKYYWIVNPVSGDTDDILGNPSAYVRPVLAF